MCGIAIAFPREAKEGFIPECVRDFLYPISSPQNPIEFDELISCLIKYESGNRQDVVGKAGEIGILQFMSSTFEKQKQLYGMEYLDIHSATDQIILTNRILQESITNLSHWTTASKCYAL